MKIAASGPAHRTAAARPASPTNAARFVEVLAEGTRPPERRAAAPPAPSTPARPPDPTQRLKQVLARAMEGDATIDALVAAAQQGRTFSPRELLAMQATVFRYSQTVEVVSRGLDRLVGGVKQTLGTPV